MAPEMIKGQAHDERLDIWCLGVLLFEMLHGYAPFGGRDDKEKCANILRNGGLKFDPALSKESVDLIRQILKTAPIDRISLDGIFRHPWMKKFEKVYKIDIQSYITPAKTDQKGKTHLSPLYHIIYGIIESHKTESSSVTSNSTKESTEASRHVTSKQTSKIITIEDNTTPLYKPADKPKPKKQISIAEVEPAEIVPGGKGLSKYIDENRRNFDVDKFLQENTSLKDIPDEPVRDYSREKKNLMGPRIESNKASSSNKAGQTLKKLKSMAEDPTLAEEDEDEFRPFSFGEKDNPANKENTNNLRKKQTQDPAKLDKATSNARAKNRRKRL